MIKYSVKKLARLSGVSVRTLHHYDELGLLKPSYRTEARYRLYSEKEMLRLQQILFYKELDFALQDICHILDDPDFDLFKSLEHQKEALRKKQSRMSTLVETIDKTMLKLRGTILLSDEELYEGMSKEKDEEAKKDAAEAVNETTALQSPN